MKVREQLIGLCAMALVAVSAASALEVSEPPAPEFKSYAREQAIDPSAEGLAKELSEQAKVLNELSLKQDKDRLDCEERLTLIGKQLETLQIKMIQVVDLVRDLKWQGRK